MNLLKFGILIFLFLCLNKQIQCQEEISLEDIFENATYATKGVPTFRFMNDGRHYSKRVGDKILQYDIETGKCTKEILDVSRIDNSRFRHNFDGYSFSSDESKLILRFETEKIYRRSTMAFHYIYTLRTGQLIAIDSVTKQLYCSFNPKANKIAYVQNNDLYFMDLETLEKKRITDDGSHNEIINGSSDWVYEEEFKLTKAYEWSPHGDKIGFIRFDERDVEEFIMTNYTNEKYPKYKSFKYPKVGEKNAQVSVLIYNLVNAEIIPAKINDEEDHYIPRIKWTINNNQLCVTKINRHQNHIKLLLVDAENGNTKIMFEESNKCYINLHDNLFFTEDGGRFIWTSEIEGYNSIFIYKMNGKLVNKIGHEKEEISSFYGVDEKRSRIYYQVAENSGLNRSIYSIGINGEGRHMIAVNEGTNEAIFSPTFDYYIFTYSNINTPPSYTVKSINRLDIRILEDNAHLKEYMAHHGTVPVELSKIPNRHGEMLNTAIIKPHGFDPNKKYPVLMYLYGGPGSQRVKNNFNSFRYYWWFQMLAQQGYVIAVVDNRGTGGRGEEFKKMTYLNLGKYETEDQIDAANFLGSLSFVDETKIGIFGWSYGGYMSSLCILKGQDVFKYAIAVAPVTNWKWYDSVYTERFMRTDKENPEGYRNYSPVNLADRLQGDFLLVHGLSDDNVHFQHTAELSKELIKHKKQFETYLYPNRNHSIFGNKARIHLFTKITNFMSRQ